MSVPNQLSYSNTRSTTVVKKYFAQLSMLVIAALAIAGVVLQVLSAKELGIFGNGISLILSAVVAAMLTMVFLSCKNGGGKPKIFFLVLHILSMIELIGFILLALLSTLTVFMLVVSSNTLLTYIFNNPDQFKDSGIDLSKGQEYYSNMLSDAKIGMLIGMIVMIAIFVAVTIFLTSQTSFLSSCKKSCKGSALYYEGAETFGTLSVVVGFIYLILIVVAFLINSSGSSTVEEMGMDSSTVSVGNLSIMFFVFHAVNAVSIFLRGTFAKGWTQYAKDNHDYVEAGNMTTVSRSADSNPIATFKSTQRKSQDAIHQSQAYSYGDPEPKDPNKKSEYIPAELQNDYPPQYDQGMGGMMNDPFMGDPFAQPAPQNPYGQDPFAADPFAADPFAQPPMGNPYGAAPNPNDQGYNNGIM